MKNKITKHAVSRYQERFDMNHKTREDDFKNALKKGKSIGEIKPSKLKDYLTSKKIKGKHIIYYKGKAYIYQKTNTKNILITVYDVSEYED